MDNDQLKTLLNKYELGECTREEIRIVEGWYNAESAIKSSSVSMEHLSKANANIWRKVITRTDLPNVIPTKEEDTETDKSKVAIKLWPGIAVAAAAVATITLGVWLYYASNLNGRHPELVSGPPLANDIAPGKNTATLTLANGKTIVLSDAKTGVVIGEDKLAYNDGTDLGGRHPEFSSGSRTREGIMLSAATPRGGTYQVTLPDGTHVWLNAASSISFPSQFNGKERKILLNGEAYFEVATDKKHPFVVEGGGQQVKVLGTHFNINAYADEGSTKTTLLEGSVRVAIGGRHAELVSASRNSKAAVQGSRSASGQAVVPDLRQDDVVLKPNQQSLITSGSDITIKEVDASDAIDWKNGEFIFNSEEIKSIMNRVAKWYDIEVVYNGPVPTEGFNGIISRNKNISQVLKMLEQTNSVHFRIEGKRVYVSK